MGFMMLQCGLGAFSAALLHIVAHSLYKAHAFLSSGSVLDSAAGRKAGSGTVLPAPFGLATLPVAIGLAVLFVSGAAWLLGIDIATKPGASILCLVLILALTYLIWQSLAAQSWRSAASGVGSAALVSVVYFASYLLMDRTLTPSVSYQVVAPSRTDVVICGAVAVGFIGVFVLQATAGSLSQRPWIRALYVHATNGFYVDIPARRLTARCWGRSIPAP
jgi:NAD(P)H-quinone oxidoreductase subunit 5